jgi:SagB-type dehydrogenase family enzyme
MIRLPTPDFAGERTLLSLLTQRHAVRQFEHDINLTDQQISQLLWAAQGVVEPGDKKTGKGTRRTVFSEGGIYPVRVYMVCEHGVRRYAPNHHALERISDGDVRFRLASAALGQNWVREASAVFGLTVLGTRLKKHYGIRAPRYMSMEAGQVAQNIQLEAVEQGLGTVVTCGFHDNGVRSILQLGAVEEPICLIPVGVPVKDS